MNFSKSTAISIWSLIAVQPNYHQQTQMRLMTNGTPTARSGLRDCAEFVIAENHRGVSQATQGKTRAVAHDIFST